MLLATLREGSPAPAPSKVMVASAKPFLANSGGNDTRSAPEQPYVLSGASTRVAAQPPASEVTSVTRPQRRPMPRSPEVAESEQARPTVNAPAAGFAPTRSDGSSLGLMSGRGLY
jgi:rare lipoprotein A